MFERHIEQSLVKRVKELGGMAEKFVCGRRAVPDRLVTLPGGVIIFVELKNEGKHATPLQQLDHERRRALGCDVRVINSMEDARAFKK